MSTEEIQRVCEECNGDGGFAIPRFCPSIGYYEDWQECSSCEGKGEVVIPTMSPTAADMWEHWAESIIGAIGHE